MEPLIKALSLCLTPVMVVLVLILLLACNSWFFKHATFIQSSKGNLAKGAISFFLTILGMLTFVLILPIDKALKGQILSFIGLILSAGIALSSTTVLGNLIAGIMNNSISRFKNGDLIKIGEFQGRVIKKSIFHTELQLEDSNFINIPNLYIAQKPVKLTRKSNTVISTTVSLGYDIAHEKIEETLKKAAIDTGLTDPYVYITNLGDFSVSYKIHGFLEDSSLFFSISSLLNAHVIDQLHHNNIEIVSPTFMNQRRVDSQIFIAEKTQQKTSTEPSDLHEKLIFDEAIKSEAIENKQNDLKETIQQLDELKKELKEASDESTKTDLQKQIDHKKELKEKLQNTIQEELSESEKTK